MPAISGCGIRKWSTAVALAIALGAAKGSSAQQAIPAPENATSEPGYLGMIADDRAEPGRGVRIVEVFPDGPAAKAGLLPGDLIVSVAGHQVQNMADLARRIEGSKSGQVLDFEVEREQGREKLSVTLGRRPAPDERPVPEFGRIPELPTIPMPATVARRRLLGVRVAPLTDEVRRLLRVPSDAQGVLVTSVDIDSPARAAGLVRDAVLTAIDGVPVRSPEELAERVGRVGPGGDLEIAFYNNGQLNKQQITLRDATESDADFAGAGAFPQVIPENAANELITLRARVDRLEAEVAELRRQLSELANPNR